MFSLQWGSKEVSETVVEDVLDKGCDTDCYCLLNYLFRFLGDGQKMRGRCTKTFHLRIREAIACFAEEATEDVGAEGGCMFCQEGQGSTSASRLPFCMNT